MAVTVREENRLFNDVIHHLPETLKGLQVRQELLLRYAWAFPNRVQYNLLKSIGFFRGSSETR